MILADFTCPHHGRFEAMADPLDEFSMCPAPSVPDQDTDVAHWQCGFASPWSPSPVRGSVRLAEVVRGANEQAASPMYLSTRELGEGMPYSEFRAKRDKMYEERRHKEGKDL